jgi:hypothetical protein
LEACLIRVAKSAWSFMKDELVSAECLLRDSQWAIQEIHPLKEG